MEFKRDYGTNILIVSPDKNIDYNIIRKPNYTFHIFDNIHLEYKEMKYIEEDLMEEGEQFTIDVERKDGMGFYYGYIFAGQIISKKINNENGFFVIKCILETKRIRKISTEIKFYLIWDKKRNEFVYIQNKKKTQNPVDDNRHQLKFFGLENEIFSLIFKKEPKLNLNMKVSDKHKKFPKKIKINEERHYFD